MLGQSFIVFFSRKSRLGTGESCFFLIVQKLYNMKKRKLTSNSSFRVGDLILIILNLINKLFKYELPFF